MNVRQWISTTLQNFYSVIEGVFAKKADTSVTSPYIVGTQSAATNLWTGNAPFASLQVGQSIRYKLPFAGTSTAATLNLTLSDGVTTTGAIAVIMNATTGITTHYASGCVLYLTYDGTNWKHDADYNTDTTYLLRSCYNRIPLSDAMYRYRLVFTSADGQTLVPANSSTSTNATAIRDVNQRPIDPFGSIYYYWSTTAKAAGESTNDATLNMQYHSFALGYSFNRTGAALNLTINKPIYLKCTPQSNGSAIMDANEPIVQSLPSAEDGKIYIFLGQAYTTASCGLEVNHPVYHYKDGAIRPWTNSTTVVWEAGTGTNSVKQKSTGSTASGEMAVAEGDQTQATGEASHAEGVGTLASGWGSHAEGIFSQSTAVASHAEGRSTVAQNFSEHAEGIFNKSNKASDSYGNAGNTQHSVGIGRGDTTRKNAFEIMQNGDTYILGLGSYDGTNPTSGTNDIKTIIDGKQVTLVSGTNIKTVNNTSLLGSGNVAVQPTLVSGTNIKTINGSSVLGSGDINIVGIDSISTNEDGTLIIALTSGDTITIDLNHEHPEYYSKVSNNTQPSGGFLPDTVYNLGTITGTITFSLAAAVSGNINHYYWIFDTDSTAPTITWPTGITWAKGSVLVPAASKHYEISILNGIAAYLEV